MKSFAQFREAHQEELKAWWFPRAVQPTYVSAGKHHVTALPLSSGDVGQRITNALKAGATRFGVLAGGSCYLHYDQHNKAGRDSALKALDFLDPQPSDQITIEDDPGAGRGYSFNSKGEAARHIRETIPTETEPSPSPTPKKQSPVVAKIKPGETYESVAKRAEAASKKATAADKLHSSHYIGYQPRPGDWDRKRELRDKAKRAHEMAAALHGAARELAPNYSYERKREHHEDQEQNHRREARS